MEKMIFITLFATLLSNQACDNTSEIRSSGVAYQEAIPVATSCTDTQYGRWESSEYVLPYPVGKNYLVSLSHCSGSYHSEGLPDQYAIDFSIEIGTTVTASRAGKVVFLEESGIDGSFPNNIVIVEHADGTFGQYMHLTENGAIVEKGDVVVPGQEIGLSGNTGLAGFPHLHFVVTKAGSYNYPYQSIPINFKNTTANERSLVAGNRYPAYAY